MTWGFMKSCSPPTDRSVEVYIKQLLILYGRNLFYACSVMEMNAIKDEKLLLGASEPVCDEVNELIMAFQPK